MKQANRLVVLDRDGVINRDSDAFVKTLAEWQPIDGSIDAIARLSKAGFTVTVASNQSGVGRGLFRRDVVHQMHRKLRRLVRNAGGEIQLIVFCPHHPDADCQCRKPRSGLLQRIARRTAQPLHGSWLVGDSMRDLEAGESVGSRLILVRSGNGEKTLQQARREPPAWWSSVTVVDDLSAAAEFIVDSNRVA